MQEQVLFNGSKVLKLESLQVKQLDSPPRLQVKLDK